MPSEWNSLRHFLYVIKYKQGKENIVANALSRKVCHCLYFKCKVIGF